MTRLGPAVAGLLVGFLAGILVSEIIGIIGYLAFDTTAGIKFLPIPFALIGAGIGLLRGGQRTTARRTEDRAEPN